MKKQLLIILFCVLVSVAAGCAKPDKVEVFRSSNKALSYSVETYYGSGPVSSDTTRVYANFEINGKSVRELVFEGENISLSKVTWTDSNTGTLCLNGGLTNTFRNTVTLILNEAYANVDTHLLEQC